MNSELPKLKAALENAKTNPPKIEIINATSVEVKMENGVYMKTVSKFNPDTMKMEEVAKEPVDDFPL